MPWGHGSNERQSPRPSRACGMVEQVTGSAPEGQPKGCNPQRVSPAVSCSTAHLVKISGRDARFVSSMRGPRSGKASRGGGAAGFSLRTPFRIAYLIAEKTL